MLTEIILENFKIFSKVRINPAQITILTGPNGSGKSTIVQALMLIKQTQDAQSLMLSGSCVEMGGIQDVRHSTGKVINIGFSGEEVMKSQAFLEKGRSEEVSFSIQAGFSPETLVDLRSEIFLENGIVEGEFRNRKQVSSEQAIEWKDGRILIQPQLNLYRPFIVAGNTGIANEDDVRKGQEYANYSFRTPQRLFESMEFIPANRGFSSPGYSLDEKAIDHFNITIPMQDYERDMATTMAYRRDELEQVISDWTSEITGIRVRAPISEGRLVQIVAKAAKVKKPKDVKIAFEGFGSNQLLFILIPLAQGLDNSVLVIEEPELHLHPKAQASLARRLLKESKEHGKQIILTTHSEHIITSVLTSVAGNMFSTEDVAIYYVRKRGQTANAKLLRIDSQGRVKGGLPGFFDASIEEAERHLKAMESKK